MRPTLIRQRGRLLREEKKSSAVTVISLDVPSEYSLCLLIDMADLVMEQWGLESPFVVQ